MRTRDLYTMYYDTLTRRFDVAWIWRIGIHSRVDIFLWKLAWGHHPTMSVLRNKGLHLPVECPWHKEEETVDHALACYPRATRIWMMAGLLSRVDLRDSPIQLLQSMQQKLVFEVDQDSRSVDGICGLLYLAIEEQLSVQVEKAVNRLILERALSQAIELTHLDSANLTVRMSDSLSALRVHHRVFVSWEPPPSTFINFNGSVMDSTRDAGFVIIGLNSRLVATSGSHLFGPSVSEAELHAAYTGIVYARQTLRV